MSIRRVVPDIGSDRFDESRQFYADVLGFKVVMDLGSVVTLASPTNPTAQITLMRRDDSSRLLPQVTIEVADVDAVYNRFSLLDPNDVVINVMTHRPGRPAEN
jgi:catechol 2,3-dioxygenase-like lactoylglutathione lyase family enzyme